MLLVQSPEFLLCQVLSAFSRSRGSSSLLCPRPCASPGPCLCYCCSPALPRQHMVRSSSVRAVFQCSAPNCPLLTAEGCPACGGCAQAGAGWRFKLSSLLCLCPSTSWDLGDRPSPPPRVSHHSVAVGPAECWLWGKDDQEPSCRMSPSTPCSRAACECRLWGSTCPKPTPQLIRAPSQLLPVTAVIPLTFLPLPALLPASSSGLFSLPAPCGQVAASLPPSLLGASRSPLPQVHAPAQPWQRLCPHRAPVPTGAARALGAGSNTPPVTGARSWQLPQPY